MSCRTPRGPAGYRPQPQATNVTAQAPAGWTLLGNAPVDAEGWDRVRWYLSWTAGGFGLDWQACVIGEDGDVVPLVVGAGDVSGAASPVCDFTGAAILRARIPAAAPPSPIAVRWSYRRHASWRGEGDER